MPHSDRVNASIHGFNAAPIFDILEKLQDKLPLAPHRYNTAQAQFKSAKHKIVEACSLEMGRINRNQARVDEAKDQTIADLQQTVKVRVTQAFIELHVLTSITGAGRSSCQGTFGSKVWPSGRRKPRRGRFFLT